MVQLHAIRLLGLAAIVAVVVLVPASRADAQNCKECKWCGLPIQPWLEECDHQEDGFPVCSDLGCLSQICTHGPWGENCEPEVAPEALVSVIAKSQMLMEREGASSQERVIAGELRVYSGTLSPSVPGEGAPEDIADYLAYSRWNSCARVERKITEN